MIRYPLLSILSLVIGNDTFGLKDENIENLGVEEIVTVLVTPGFIRVGDIVIGFRLIAAVTLCYGKTPPAD
ncbi:MAG: hypothetical protein QGH39_02150 [Candidatus Thermoplasmatota archaeon]|jgi:hypothetical protein|nr:hypothetical protein [Candidatus Thermoplasmatota archaeon]MDP7264342.1 hypothetical protein [Candidatus Thermoplasmatota archaeon]